MLCVLSMYIRLCAHHKLHFQRDRKRSSWATCAYHKGYLCSTPSTMSFLPVSVCLFTVYKRREVMVREVTAPVDNRLASVTRIRGGRVILLRDSRRDGRRRDGHKKIFQKERSIEPRNRPCRFGTGLSGRDGLRGRDGLLCGGGLGGGGLGGSLCKHLPDRRGPLCGLCKLLRLCRRGRRRDGRSCVPPRATHNGNGTCRVEVLF